jgi:hypothetical protein
MSYETDVALKHDKMLDDLETKIPKVGDVIRSDKLQWCEKDPFTGQLEYRVGNRKSLMVTAAYPIKDSQGKSAGFDKRQVDVADFDETRKDDTFVVSKITRTPHGFCGCGFAPGNFRVELRRRGVPETIFATFDLTGWHTFNGLLLEDVEVVGSTTSKEVADAEWL